MKNTEKTLFIRTLLPKYYSFIIYYKLYQPGNINNSYSKRDYSRRNYQRNKYLRQIYQMNHDSRQKYHLNQTIVIKHNT